MASTFLKADQHFEHKRLPASDWETSCNATIPLLDGSQMVALGRQTIGGQCNSQAIVSVDDYGQNPSAGFWNDSEAVWRPSLI